jgi:hypothetical protein
MPEKHPDYHSEAGAKLLARKIEQFWKSGGYDKVMVAAVPVSHARWGAVWIVQSNIGIGGPPR